jgi:aldose 1-epimerase
MTTARQSGSFATEIRYDETLNTTVLSLSYTDPHNPARNMLACVAPDLGSNLFRFRVGEHELIHCEQDLLKHMDYTGDFVLWPFPNRVRDKRYSYQGHEYSLVDLKRPSGNWVLIHGLVFDEPWQYELPVVQAEAASVRTFIDINQQSSRYAMYPFESRLSLTYTLTKDGLSIQYQVENTGSGDLPYGFALHPYFSLLSGKQDTYVSLPASSVMEADDELLPTGRVLSVDSVMYSMFDLRQPVPIGNLKLDHVYTALEPQSHALIDYRTLGLQLQISGTDDFTHAVIYAPPDMDAFFCLEYQTCSTDAINFNNQGEERKKMAHLLEVHPGETKSGALHYTVIFNQ